MGVTREDHSHRARADPESEGATFTDVMRRLLGRPAVLARLVLALGVVTGVAMVLLPASWEGLVAIGLGIPLGAWIIRRG